MKDILVIRIKDMHKLPNSVLDSLCGAANKVSKDTNFNILFVDENTRYEVIRSAQ